MAVGADAGLGAGTEDGVGDAASAMAGTAALGEVGVFEVAFEDPHPVKHAADNTMTTIERVILRPQ